MNGCTRREPETGRIPDPSKVQGSEEERFAAFLDACSALSKRIELFLSLGPEKIERLVLRDRLRQIHEDAGE
jgi:arsenate reductase